MELTAQQLFEDKNYRFNNQLEELQEAQRENKKEQGFIEQLQERFYSVQQQEHKLYEHSLNEVDPEERPFFKERQDEGFQLSRKALQAFEEYNASQQELDKGLAQVKDCKAWNAASGTFDIKKLDMNWAKSITTRWKDRQKKIDAKVKAYTLANQEITTKFDEYGNVLGVYVDGKFDAELTNTLQESIRTHNFDMIKGFGSGFIDQLANNNGKSLLNEWFGERKFGAEFSGTKNYAVGQFVADLASLVQGGAEFIGGGLWAFGGSAASTVFSGGAGAITVPAINASGLAISGHGAGVFTSAWGSLGDGYSYEDNSYTNKNGEWGNGKFDNTADNIQDHFEKHGDEVGASSIEQYMRKVQEFARTVKKGVKPSPVSGATQDVLRYRKNRKHIDLAPNGSIISFSKNFEQRSNGLDYYGRTYLDSEGITVLKGIIGGWLQIFKYAPVQIELTSDYDIENGKFNSVIIDKEYLLTQLQNLFDLCDSALKKDYILVHFGI